MERRSFLSGLVALLVIRPARFTASILKQQPAQIMPGHITYVSDWRYIVRAVNIDLSEFKD